MALYRLGSSRTGSNLQHLSRPGSSYRCHPRTPSVLGEPSPRRGNASGFRRTFEAQGLDAHVARRARTASPRPKSIPPTSTRRFASRRHKSRGDPSFRIGPQCGQVVVREGAQRPGVKVYVLRVGTCYTVIATFVFCTSTRTYEYQTC